MFEDFTSCAVCQHNNGEKCELFGRVIGMHGCSSGVERKPRNHFEEIKAMSAEELAEIFETLCPSLNWTIALNGKSWLEWLKEESKDGKA